MAEDKLRTLTKSLGYRVATVIQGYVVAYALTGNPTISLKYTLWTNLIGVVMYYSWERLWNRIDWRRQ